MFPFEIVENEEIEEEKETILREYEIDFETGELTGKMVEGLEAIKVWIWCVLQTARYRYVIYSWDYGTEIEDLIGQPQDAELLESEAERMINECLLVNPVIQSIDDFSIEIHDNDISISFVANTELGAVYINV